MGWRTIPCVGVCRDRASARSLCGDSTGYSMADQARTACRETVLLLEELLFHPIDARKARRAVTRSRPPVLVSLGSGRNVDRGWIGIDLTGGTSVFRADLRRKLPLASQSVDAILAEHLLEHLLLHQINHLLCECHRILRPGGILRIVCPDGLLVASLLAGGSGERVQRQLTFEASLHGFAQDELLALSSVNRISHQWGEHRSLLTAEGVRTLAERAGFAGVRQVGVLASNHFHPIPGTHLRRYPGSENEAFAVEAVR